MTESQLARVLNAFARVKYKITRQQTVPDENDGYTQVKKWLLGCFACFLCVLLCVRVFVPGVSGYELLMRAHVLTKPAVGFLLCQGMNILLGPFLCIMSEVDAFFCFSTLMLRHCPRYVLKNMEGVHEGGSLVDKLLAVLDPQLHAHLKSKQVPIPISAFPFLSSCMGCLKPLSEVCRLWDVVFAVGFHFIVVLCTTLVRDSLSRGPASCC